MKKLLTAGALAGAIAFSPALAAPAQAGDNDDALLGIGLAAALGTAIILSSDYDDDHRYYNRGYTRGHVHKKDCHHGHKHGHKHGHAHKKGHKYDHDHDRNYRRGDRHDDYYRGDYRKGRYDRDHRYGRYDRFDNRDARRIAKRHYDVDVQTVERVRHWIVVKGWDRRGMWTRISFNAHTGEVGSVKKKNRRG